MGFGAMLGKAATNLLTGRNRSSGPDDGPQMKRKDSALGMAMKGVMKLKKRSKPGRGFGASEAPKA